MKIASATTLIFSLTAAFLQAQAVPGLISYQGRVVDGTGAGLGTGTALNRKILFRLFDAGTGGTRLWSEEQTVTLSNGDFSVILGQGVGASYNGSPENPRPSLLTVFAGTDRYLEIVVDNGDGAFNATDTPITPRQRLISTAFAVRASVADGIASGSDFNLKDANHGLGWFGTDKLFNGINLDGPALYGFSGGILGSVNGASQTAALRWDSQGRVGIGGGGAPTEKLDVTGNAKISGSGTFGSALSIGGGIAPPTVNSGGTGMRLSLFPGDSSVPPFGFGIDTSTLFSVVPTTAFHKWYGGTSVKMSLNGSNGNLIVSGSLNAGATTVNGALAANDNIALNGEKNLTLYDANHGLGYYGSVSTAKSTFANTNINGPVLFGFSGGALGSTNGGQRIALRWDDAMNVTMGGSFTAPVKINGGVTPPPANSGGNATGMRLTLFPANSDASPFGFGIADNTLFSVVPSSAVHKWYGGATEKMSLNGSSGNLAVSGKVTTNGKTAAVGDEELRIIRGTLSSAPGSIILAGSGFTFTHNSGDHSVTFTTPFSTAPTVTANPFGIGDRDIVVIRTITNTGFTMSMRNGSDGSLTNWPITFIAIGPR